MTRLYTSKALLRIALSGLLAATAAAAQQPAQQVYRPIPGFDATSIDTGIDPCNDFYQFACGKFAANHPIPADQPEVDEFYALFNVNTQELSGILVKAGAGGATRTPNEQKIGDYYKACMDTGLIEKLGLAPIQPMLDAIAALNDKAALPALAGMLQRNGVDVFFGYGEQQDFQDASKQIAEVAQAGLGLPEKDYYLRTGAKDVTLRNQYIEHITKMLTLAGSTPQQALSDAHAILDMETALAKASLSVTEMRDPKAIYHLQPLATFEAALPDFNFEQLRQAMHSPAITELNNSTPAFFPALLEQIRSVPLPTLKAYMRYHLLTAAASQLPQRFDDENFDFYGRKLSGQPEQRQRWKRCSNNVNTALGEALGEVYVKQYFAGDSKAKMLEMVHNIEAAMDRDIQQVDWMSPATKQRAEEKLHLVANKIGYPDKWRDYSSLAIKPDDPLGNMMRADAFENDRELNKIGKPVDHNEWSMTPPTVNAYYDPSMNDINFPAGILQPSFYDPKQTDATNYGHIGAVIGHELTHGFDDQGSQFDGHGNLSDWWTADDKKNFNDREDCLVNEYGSFTAVDDIKINGKLTLGENTADNGGLLLAYMAYMQHARDQHIDLTAKQNGYTPAQQFYIAYAQNWCENTRPEYVRQRALTDPHSPDHFRANGAIVNQPGFTAAFSCKKDAPMVPAKSCRVW